MEHDSSPRTQKPGVLKLMENVVGVRERPITNLSPEVKRSKTAANNFPIIVYPSTVPVPSKRVIRELYKASLEEGCNGENENNPGEKNHYNDQKHLTPAAVLSFDNVLLPAIGLEEEKALKRLQSKLQRDSPEYKFLMENCRRLVRESIRCAMHKVQSSRSIRYRCQQERKQRQIVENKRKWDIEQRARKEEQKRMAEELSHKKETSRAEKRRYLAREHPRNQELWKEIVFLTSSVAQLEREERMWIQTEQDMDRLKDKQDFLRKEKHPYGNLEQRCDESISSSSSSHAILLQAKTNQLQTETEDKVKDLILTSNRIQKGLEMIMKLLSESETLRKELYVKYKKDHVFRGYQSVHNPKSMIRFLSQSQDDHVKNM